MLVTDPRRFQAACGPIESHGRMDLLLGSHLPEHLSLDVVAFFHLCDFCDFYVTILPFCMADGKVEYERLREAEIRGFSEVPSRGIVWACRSS